MEIKSFPLEKQSFLYSRYAEPVLSVQSGETFAVKTMDCWCNIDDRNTKSATSLKDRWIGGNPLVGPIFVEGAEPGDGLKIEIVSITPDRDYAFSTIEPYAGGLSCNPMTPMLHESLPEHFFLYDIKDGWATHSERLSFPLDPFIGSIGTAPAISAISSVDIYPAGGNMDMPDIKPGNTLYLPVCVPGGYLYLGDIHAKQGHGELCGSALEITADVCLTVSVVKGQKINTPRIENEEYIACIGCGKPMEDAARIAYRELIRWMTELGWDQYEAYQALSQVGELSVGSMVCNLHTLIAKIPKKYALK